ncbi:MAG: methionine-R-sulfoxide reductase, partial [Solirubrobacterales bacterium]|nr:methionine-R-sulfoxide reductase [Solirubrobacterales bacterium]
MLELKGMATDQTKVVKSEQEWREQLTPAQYEVLRKAGTEPPFSGDYVYNKASGDYRCAACAAVLFAADTKF